MSQCKLNYPTVPSAITTKNHKSQVDMKETTLIVLNKSSQQKNYDLNVFIIPIAVIYCLEDGSLVTTLSQIQTKKCFRNDLRGI